jgi:hypothetical protein
MVFFHNRDHIQLELLHYTFGVAERLRMACEF